MDGANPVSNVWFWLFYHALPFILKQVMRIITVCCLKLYDKVPLKSMITPLLEFVLRESQKFYMGSEDLFPIE